MNRTRTSSLALAGSAALLLASACSKSPAESTGSTATIQRLMQARNLSEENVIAALKTYTPTGEGRVLHLRVGRPLRPA